MDTIMLRCPPLTTFTIFSALPTELRLKIFRDACFSRILTLSYEQSTDSFGPCPQPSLLSTCHEARQEALRIYTPFFATSSQEPHIYFNLFRDTIYLPRLGQMGYDDTLRDFKKLVHDETGLLDEITHIAIDHVCMEIKRPWESYNKSMLLEGFRNLQEVTLVLANDNIPGDAQVQLIEPSVDPEKQLRIWYHFRRSITAEKRLLEDSCKADGREYKAFSLPTMRIKAKVAQVNVGNLQQALGRMEV